MDTNEKSKSKLSAEELEALEINRKQIKGIEERMLDQISDVNSCFENGFNLLDTVIAGLLSDRFGDSEVAGILYTIGLSKDYFNVAYLRYLNRDFEN